MLAEFTPYIVSILIALAGGAFRGFAGFGGGLLMAPLLTLIHAPDVVVPMLIVLGLVGDVRLLPEVRREVNVRRILWVAGPALFGLPLGIYALATLDGELVRRVVNATVLLLAVLLARGVRFRGADRPVVLAPAGVVSGVLTGIGGIGGPPVVLTYLSLMEPASQTRANLIGYFSISGIAALAMMITAGVFEGESATLAAVCAVPYFLAIHLGSRRFRAHSADASYRKIALVFLGCVALFGLLWPL